MNPTIHIPRVKKIDSRNSLSALGKALVICVIVLILAGTLAAVMQYAGVLSNNN